MPSRHTTGLDLRDSLVAYLRRRPRKAAFVAEAAGWLRRSGADAEAVERALEALDAERKVLVRPQYCGDPHLTAADLRVVALVDAPDGEQDPVARASEQIDAVWGQWLGDYLAGHQCS